MQVELGGGGGGIGNKNFNGGGDGGDDDGDDDDYFGEDDGDDDGDNKGLFGRRVVVPEVRLLAIPRIRFLISARAWDRDDVLVYIWQDSPIGFLWWYVRRCLIESTSRLSYRSGLGRSATCRQAFGRLLNWCVYSSCISVL